MSGEGRQPLYGNMIPYGDPSWYRGHNSPYYKPTHHAFRAKMREFTEREIIPYVSEWEESKSLPTELLKKCYEAQILPSCVGGKWQTEYIGPGPDSFDAFHELIMIDELSRCGSGGVMWGIMGGLAIGLPPVIQFASKYIKDKCVADCLRGEKRICLCITEPTAGSDVANLRCSAVKDPSGRFYIVNGEKKWITNGVTSDFFTVAVRTGGPGMGGLSLLLIERSMPGVETKQMNCTGVWSSGTTFITFDDVKVPVENLIGTENHGFKYIMYNFNHERWMLIGQAVRFARVCLEESVKHAQRRKTFGKALIEHPVIRWKLAEMARQVEATQALLEHLTYQFMTMSKDEQNLKLGGETAMLKAQATKVSNHDDNDTHAQARIIRAHTHAHTHTRTHHTRAHTRTHARTHTRTRTRTHAHARIPSFLASTDTFPQHTHTRTTIHPPPHPPPHPYCRCLSIALARPSRFTVAFLTSRAVLARLWSVSAVRFGPTPSPGARRRSCSTSASGRRSSSQSFSKQRCRQGKGGGRG